MPANMKHEKTADFRGRFLAEGAGYFTAAPPCKCANALFAKHGIFKEFHLDTVVNGDLYRLYNPFTSNLFGVNVVSKDKRKAILLLINYRKDNNKHRYIKFKGLDEGKVYKTNLENKCYSGDFLMKNGLNLSKWLNEFESFFVTLKEIDN